MRIDEALFIYFVGITSDDYKWVLRTEFSSKNPVCC